MIQSKRPCLRDTGSSSEDGVASLMQELTESEEEPMSFTGSDLNQDESECNPSIVPASHPMSFSTSDLNQDDSECNPSIVPASHPMSLSTSDLNQDDSECNPSIVPASHPMSFSTSDLNQDDSECNPSIVPASHPMSFSTSDLNQDDSECNPSIVPASHPMSFSTSDLNQDDSECNPSIVPASHPMSFSMSDLNQDDSECNPSIVPASHPMSFSTSDLNQDDSECNPSIVPASHPMSFSTSDLNQDDSECSPSIVPASHPTALDSNSSSPPLILDCYIPCLRDKKELLHECEQLGLTMHKAHKRSYEIDLIIDDRIDGDTEMYLVKWKNWPMNSNTWEPECNLTGCPDLKNLYKFVKKKSSSLSLQTIRYFLKDVINRTPMDVMTINNLFDLFYPDKNYKIGPMRKNVFKLIKKLKSIKNAQLLELDEEKFWDVMFFAHERKLVLINLLEWESDFNLCTNSPYINVENDVDLELAPNDFQFIHDYMSTGIEIQDSAVVGCECENCFTNCNDCCPKQFGGRFAYDQHGMICLDPDCAVYECNRSCSCGPDCRNRVVQHGPKVKLAIFRTSNGRGWGLKTLQIIKKGQFVLEYIGEIISRAEVERRFHIYNANSRSYVFDLDFDDCKSSFMVDSGHLGNVSHFMNHSCSPNVAVHPIWINQLDARLPRIALFAKRKINIGEELTFDYHGTKPNSKDSTFSTPCNCASKKCRKYF